MKFLSYDGLTYFWTKAKNYIDTSIANKANVNHTHTKSQITDFPTSMTPATHNQAASTITAGTFAGQVVAPAGTDYTTARIRNIVVLPKASAPTDGSTSSYSNGTIIFVRKS